GLLRGHIFRSDIIILDKLVHHLLHRIAVRAVKCIVLVPSSGKWERSGGSLIKYLPGLLRQRVLSIYCAWNVMVPHSCVAGPRYPTILGRNIREDARVTLDFVMGRWCAVFGRWRCLPFG